MFVLDLFCCVLNCKVSVCKVAAIIITCANNFLIT